MKNHRFIALITLGLLAFSGCNTPIVVGNILAMILTLILFIGTLTIQKK